MEHATIPTDISGFISQMLMKVQQEQVIFLNYTKPNYNPSLDVPLVEVVAVVLWDVPDGDARCAHRVRVRGGVVVFSHAPAGDLAVPLVQLVQRVVRLRNAYRQDVETVEAIALLLDRNEFEQNITLGGSRSLRLSTALFLCCSIMV